MFNSRKSIKILLPTMLVAVTGAAFFFSAGTAARTNDAAGPLAAYRTPVCSAATLRGQFAFKGEGVVPSGPPPAPMVPFGVMGLLTFDGDGNLTNQSTASNNGVIQSGLRQGTYTVNEDCTGTLQVVLPFPPYARNHNLVISDKGDSFYMIGTDPSVVTFEAKRLR